jgi:hypothetical protein
MDYGIKTDKELIMMITRTDFYLYQLWLSVVKPKLNLNVFDAFELKKLIRFKETLLEENLSDSWVELDKTMG